MTNVDRLLGIERRSQVSDQSEPGHCRPVAGAVVRSPAWLHGVHIRSSQSGSNERMPLVDAGIEQAHVRHVFFVAWHCQPALQVFQPFRLIFRR